MDKQQRLTIGIGLAGIALAWYWSKQTNANVQASVQAIGNAFRATLQPPTTVTPQDPFYVSPYPGYGVLLDPPAGWGVRLPGLGSVQPTTGPLQNTTQNGADYTLPVLDSRNPLSGIDLATYAPGSVQYGDGSIDLSNGAPQPGINLGGDIPDQGGYIYVGGLEIH